MRGVTRRNSAVLEAYLRDAGNLPVLWLTRNLLDSRQGRAIRALKGGNPMAESMDVPIARTKIVAFFVAIVFAALSGWLNAHLQRFVNPIPFSLHHGIEYLFMAVIGGRRQPVGRATRGRRVHRAHIEQIRVDSDWRSTRTTAIQILPADRAVIRRRSVAMAENRAFAKQFVWPRHR